MRLERHSNSWTATLQRAPDLKAKRMQVGKTMVRHWRAPDAALVEHWTRAAPSRPPGGYLGLVEGIMRVRALVLMCICSACVQACVRACVRAQPDTEGLSPVPASAKQAWQVPTQPSGTRQLTLHPVPESSDVSFVS